MKETLEEAAEKEFPLLDTEQCKTGAVEEENLQLLGHRKSFIAGANWQAERMYSEEDMKLAFESGYDLNTFEQLEIPNNEREYFTFKDWFEQFKKK
jgi:hypothetical protein